MTQDMTVLAVDPGKLTGVALIHWTGNQEDDPTVEHSEEVDETQFASLISSLFLQANLLSANNHLACERFTINAQTAKKSQAPYSLEMIGVLKHLVRTERFSPEEIVFQAPVDAKNMFPNPALKKLNVWHKGGEGHALDSLRHALLLLTKKGYIPSKLLE